MIDALLQWTPRILSLLVAGFCYLFMLEAFSPGFGWKDAFMHFVQGNLMLLIALISWKWEIVGGVIYLGLGAFILLRWRKARTTWTIASVLIGVGALFIVSYLIQV